MNHLSSPCTRALAATVIGFGMAVASLAVAQPMASPHSSPGMAPVSLAFAHRHAVRGGNGERAQ